MTLRRYSELRSTVGTTWSPAVRAHVRSHVAGCIGPLAGMPGPCLGQVEIDHLLASHATGRKSRSIATNAAPLCGAHHRVKTERGKLWRPRLLAVLRRLTRGCRSCAAEWRAAA